MLYPHISSLSSDAYLINIRRANIPRKGYVKPACKSLKCEIKINITVSQCVLEEYAKDNHYASYDPQSYHCCREMHYIVNY